MALLSRLFSNRRNTKEQFNLRNKNEPQKRWEPPFFDKQQVRLVMYQDHDLKGRRLLFDSKAVKLVDEPQIDPKVRCRLLGNSAKKDPGKPPPYSDGSGYPRPSPKYKLQRPGSDTKMLGEMMFGSIAMSYKGATLKVHTIRSPPQLMVTKVFIPKRPKEGNSESENYDTDSLQGSTVETSNPKEISGAQKGNATVAQSVPVDVPIPNKGNESEEDEYDSGIIASATSSNSSFTASFPSPGSSRSSSINSNSFNSLKRRWIRSQNTSFEHNVRKHLGDDPSCVQPTPMKPRAAKIGVCIIFHLPEDRNPEHNRHFHHFFFSHITLIEGHINKLGNAVEQAVFNKNKFIMLTVEALERFRDALCDLYTAPRIPRPLWLHMMCFTSQRLNICHDFLKDFMTLVDKYDTKSTKFFVSSLLTAVLTNHLAWVPTVTPAGASPSRSYLTKHSAKWLNALAKSHPYNPLWAQLGDLYGALGLPLRLSRTVIVGKRSEMVTKFLNILTYFIRCSEIHENIEQKLIDRQTSEEMSPCSPDMDDCQTLYGSSDADRKYAFSESPRDILIGSPCSKKVTRFLRQNSNMSNVSVDSEGLDSFTSDYPSFGSFSQCDTPKCNRTNTSGILDSSLTSHTEFNARNDSNQQNSAGTVLEGNINANDTKFSFSATDCDKETIENVCELSPTPVIEKSTIEPIRYVGRCSVIQRDNTTLSDVNSEKISANNVSIKRNKLAKDNDLKFRPESGICECETRSDNQEILVNNEERSDTESIDNDGRKCKDEIRDEHTAVALESNEILDSGVYDNENVTSASDSTGERIQKMIRVKSTSVLEDTKHCDRDSGLVRVSLRCHDTISEITDKTGEKGFESEINDNNKSISLEAKCESISVPTLLYRLHSTDSMFDEYFEEKTDVLTNSQAHEKGGIKIPQLKRIPSVEINPSVFDKYMTESLPTDLPSPMKEKELNLTTEGIVIHDNYYSANTGIDTTDNCDTSVTSVISKESERDKKYNEMDKTGVIGINDVSKVNAAVRPETLLLPAKLSSQDSFEDSFEVSSSRNLLSRQSSTLSGTKPAKIRPITPTQLRTRHASSVSCISDESSDSLANLQEVLLPKSNVTEDLLSRVNFERNFGCSLLAANTDHYMPDFVLQGTTNPDFIPQLENDLSLAVQNCVLGEPISEAVCVVANTDDWSVKQYSCQYSQSEKLQNVEVTSSELVSSIIESVQHLWKLKMAPEFCLTHLEDRLQEVYFKSIMLAEFMRTHKKINKKELATSLGIDVSDLPLLQAVAGIHTPLLSVGLLL